MKSSFTLKYSSFVCFVLLLFATGSCNVDSPCVGPEMVYVPAAPDYSIKEMWRIIPNDTLNQSVDVFYIPSTWEYDWKTDQGEICHYADPSRPDHRADMQIEMDGVSDYMAEGRNFYSPFYRHITLDSWATLNEDTINRRYFDVSFKDVEASFRYFIEKFNNGRPFILAGFSQGGKSVVELMKTLDKSERDRMVAAYVLGYKITPDDIRICPEIVGARDSLDTGIVVCYNSVSDVKYVKPIVAAPNVIGINPVNWKTDNSKAFLNDSVSVTLDPRLNVLVVNGYDGSDLPNILGILNVGDYHGAEPWLYSECLRKNFKQRAGSFLLNH